MQIHNQEAPRCIRGRPSTTWGRERKREREPWIVTPFLRVSPVKGNRVHQRGHRVEKTGRMIAESGEGLDGWLRANKAAVALEALIGLGLNLAVN